MSCQRVFAEPDVMAFSIHAAKNSSVSADGAPGQSVQFAGKLRKRASIICPVCGAAMEIILTRISKPPTRQIACLT